MEGSPRSSAPATQQWSSGRVLTAEQRQRKREVNRESARQSKQNLQDQVEKLSKRVLELEAWRERCERLGTVVRAPEHIVFTEDEAGQNNHEIPMPTVLHVESDAYGTYPEVELNTWITGAVLSPTPNDAISSLEGDLVWAEDESNPLIGMMEMASASNSMENDTVPMMEHGSVETSTASNSVETIPPITYTRTMDCTPSRQSLHPKGREVTRACNAAIAEVRKLAPQLICTNDVSNQDVLCRAILLHGWDAAFKRYSSICPLWRILRSVDNVLFQHCELKERLCVLRIIHLMYLVSHGNSSSY
ncbi:hypothetical protein Slin15195_G052380 [Septoria linicola]|uniref:BZIP domain-containing protein n=1 Tax=Septoria linicola TaxID=215465 RepID=A0A9Q9AMA0_9PEZI|nr:hypothetical protein Slin14017_G127860 [Septoria linicola]USW51919.1 hypothetical protein Slin15195_G052380 [Septoria linicola]